MKYYERVGVQLLTNNTMIFVTSFLSAKIATLLGIESLNSSFRALSSSRLGGFYSALTSPSVFVLPVAGLMWSHWEQPRWESPARRQTYLLLSLCLLLRAHKMRESEMRWCRRRRRLERNSPLLLQTLSAAVCPLLLFPCTLFSINLHRRYFSRYQDATTSVITKNYDGLAEPRLVLNMRRRARVVYTVIDERSVREMLNIVYVLPKYINNDWELKE